MGYDAEATTNTPLHDDASHCPDQAVGARG